MKSINNPHDKFFKTLIKDKKNAIAFSNEYLPEDITGTTIRHFLYIY